MDRHRTEIEQVAHEAIIRSTMEIDLGVRSWSNVSSKLSTSALLYDSAWKRAITVHGNKAAALKGGFWPSKTVALGLTALIAASAAIGFGMTHFMDGKTLASVPVVVPQALQPKAAPVVRVAPIAPVTPLAEVIKEAPPQPVAVTPVVSTPEAIMPVPVKPAEPMPTKKVPAAMVKPAKDKNALSLPKPPAAPQSAMPLPTVPYFPAPLGMPQQAPAAPLRDLQQAPLAVKEEPLLAVDETVKHAVAAKAVRADEPRPADKPVAGEESIARPVAIASKFAEPKVTEQPMKMAGPRDTPRRTVAEPFQADKPLPNYTVLAPSASGVVISDPETRLPKEFGLGEKLPSGETIKSVTKSGEVVTDRRTLKMSE